MKPGHLLAVAVALHVVLTCSLYQAGRLALFPNVINADGIAVSYASDGLNYRREAVSLAGLLRNDGLLAWVNRPSPLHVKLYSLSFAAFGPVFGNTILCAEPLNAMFYLAILWLVWKLGRLVFGPEASALPVVAVALWPTFVLHTTQLLRDPLFIVAVLALVYVMAVLLTRIVSLRRGAAAGAAAGGLGALLWMVRDAMWEVVLLIILLGTALLLVRQVRDRVVLGGNMLGAVLAAVLSLIIVPWYITPYRTPRKTDSPGARPPVAVVDGRRYSTSGTRSPSLVMQARLIPARIIHNRRAFTVVYPNASSNIDADVTFNSAADIIRYAPRALSIGLFAPFPSMWFGAGGDVGSAGRVLGGLETLVMYACELLALVCLWNMRRNLAVWWMAMIVLGGVAALGLVVVNIGALYRMRYMFWILLILLGAEGAAQVRRAWLARKAQGRELPSLVFGEPGRTAAGE